MKLGIVRSHSQESARVGWAYLNTEDPIVAWETYRGIITNRREQQALGLPPLTLWGVKQLRNLSSIEFKNELLLEKVRIENFPDKISRLTGFFHFSDLDAARSSKVWRFPHFKDENLAEIGFDPEAPFSTHDAEWISNHRWGEHGTDWMEKYWAGEPYKHRYNEPIWETLTEASGVIWGTAIRENAYQTIKARHPASLPLLELARIAAEGGYPPGYVSPFIIKPSSSQNPRVQFILRAEEFNDPGFLNYLQQYQGPVRHNLTQLITPDFRDQGFEVHFLST